MEYQDLPVLVTGHTGFKGAWLCTILQKMGARVHGYALEPEENSLYNTLSLDVPEKIADIRELDSLQSYMNTVRPRLVFHLAAQAVVSEGRHRPIDTFSTNIMGLVHVLETSVHAGVEAVVVVSTDKVYAPQTKACSPTSKLGGTDPYSASKTAAEFVIPSYTDRLQISIARAGNAIGGGDWGTDRLIPDIMRAYKNKRDLQIRHPKATRPWIHVSELIRAYVLLGTQTLSGRHTQAFNFGSPISLSVEEILQEMKANGITPNIHTCAFPPPENQELILDCTDSEYLLGWQARHTPQEAIAWTIEEYGLLCDPEGLRAVMWSRMGWE